MKIDFKHFQDNLPPHISEFLDLCLELDITPSIIGGITRDYLLKNIIGSDFDICLRANKGISQRIQIIDTLKKLYPKYEEKKFGVMDLGGGIEISWPRIETFSNKIGHSNFDVEFIDDFDFKKDVLRRDFTINAISFSYTDAGFILNDPLDGVNALRNEQLIACDHQSFVQDPIRFLRAIRFHLLLDFEFDVNLKILLENMQLSLSSHYLKYEALKAKLPLSFFIMVEYYQRDVLSLSFDQQTIENVLDYEKQVKCTDLSTHISLCYLIPIDKRLSLLKLLSLKKSYMPTFEPRDISLLELKKYSFDELTKFSFIKELIRFLDIATGLNKDFLLYFNFKDELSLSFYEKYSDLDIVVPKDIKNNLRSIFVFSQKINKLL